ncbi:hypothetical protein IEO21_09415 [Rhodonia placenta]|uniref:Uncharacterized protein n=1 Tax=Rhodonia placenta TaxID=104341 RepID=A0A8H7NSN3_9APHY|nr:hypothetical protein IEO21_10306 [Postia placenta]KAF9804388.1 hypothetical protein IEO21_09415 [Postia placenta]
MLKPKARDKKCIS